jgi:hypothetical protein
VCRDWGLGWKVNLFSFDGCSNYQTCTGFLILVWGVLVTFWEVLGSDKPEPIRVRHIHIRL